VSRTCLGFSLPLIVAAAAACGDPESAPDARAPDPIDAGVDAVPDASDPDAMVDAMPRQLAVNVKVEGDGDGYVESSDGRIRCPGTCTAIYTEGDVVTLISRPGEGSRLRWWRGNDSATTETYSVTVGQEQWVIAEMVPIVLTRAAMSVGTGYRAVEASVYDPADDTMVIAGHLGPDATICGARVDTQDGIYVAKVDATTGACRWAQAFATSDWASPNGLAIVDGDVIVGGYFQRDVQFGERTLNAPYSGGFMVRLGGDDGALIWTVPASDAPMPGIEDLAVTPSGSLLTCGGGPSPIRAWSASGQELWTSDTDLPWCAGLAVAGERAYGLGLSSSGGGAYAIRVSVIGTADGSAQPTRTFPVTVPYIDVHRLVALGDRVYALVSEIASEDTYLLSWQPESRSYDAVLVASSHLDVQADVVVDRGRLLTIGNYRDTVGLHWWTTELEQARTPTHFDGNFLSGLRATTAPGQPVRLALSTWASNVMYPEDFNGLWLGPTSAEPVLLEVATNPESPRLP
jgi:hypothetical protein